MILKRARSLLKIGDTMRLLCCLLLVWSTLLSDAKAQTTNQSQAAAIAAIEKLGGKVTFDEKNPSKPLVGVDLSNTKVTDAELVHLKGLASLRDLTLWRTDVSDSGLVHLKGLASLQSLILQQNSKVTDAGLVHLKDLTGLQTLNLGHTNVTDVGLVHLNGLTSLKTLSLAFNKITGTGLVHLRGMTNLQMLSLYGTDLTDAGLEQLEGLTSLQSLILYRCTKFTDAGLEHLKDLTKLQMLILYNAKVTDAGLKHLKRLTSLRTLHLANTQVTDAGLVHLRGLTRLQTLDLRGTSVTTGGVKELNSALPKCRISPTPTSRMEPPQRIDAIAMIEANGSPESITYKPFLANVWKAKNQSTKLFSWEGEQVVFLTTTNDFDSKTMAAFVKRLDATWKRCGDLVGQSPKLIRQHKGKVTIAAVPDLTFTVNTGTGFGFAPHGMGAIEVAGFYGPQGDYERIRKDPQSFPDHYFLLIGQNHSVPMDGLNMARNGSALLLQQLCNEDFKLNPSEAQAQKSVELFEISFAQSTATFAEAFPRFGAKKPVPIKDIDGKALAASDLNLLFASCLMKARQDNGGDAYIKRFYRHLSECPPVAWRQYKLPDIAKGQVLNWVVAASLAAGKDLTPWFRDRWRFPIEPEVWQAFKSVDWGKPDLAISDVFDSLPFAQLPREIAIHLPGFLTPERRKQSLIIGGTFEDGSGTWKDNSWRSNKAAVAVVSSEAKQGRNSVAVRSPRVRDHAYYEQKVSVKPNTRYLVSGWIKTKDVVVVEEGGQLGANISIGAVSSRSFEGTNGWRYATLIFDSRQLNEVSVSARLGYRYSTAKGEAWFDDLCMIPLSPDVVRVTPPAALPPLVNKENKSLTLRGHTDKIINVAFSPDGQRMASASMDRTVKVWNTATGDVLLTLKGHTGRVWSVAFSPDGQRLVSSGGLGDQTVKVWNAATGQELLTLKGHTDLVSNVVFSPNGKLIASTSGDRTVKVWDAATGKELQSLTGHTDTIISAVFSPDGLRLASASFDKTAKLWDAATGKELLTLKGHTSALLSVAFSSNGKRLASASMDRTVKVWDATSGQVTLTLKGHTNAVSSVTFSADGQQLASAGYDQTVKVWDATTGQESFTLNGHTDVVRSVTFSPNGKRLASASHDKTVKVWDVSPAANIARQQQATIIARRKQAAIVARQRQAEGDRHRGQKEYAQAIACYREVIQHDPNNRQIINRLAWVLSVNPMTDQPTGEALRLAQRVTQQQPENAYYRNSLGAAQFRSGQYAEALSNLVFVANAQPRGFGWLAHNLLYQTLCHTKLGNRASAQVAYDKALPLLKRAEGNTTHQWHEARLLQQEIVALGIFERVPELFTLKGHTGAVLSVAYSPDGKLIASGSRDESVKLWNATTGQEVRSLKGSLAYVTSVAFSPDSKTLATPSMLELNAPGDVKLWDVATGQRKALLTGHRSQVWTANYSSDGKRLVSCSSDGTLYFWDAASGERLQELKTGVRYFVRVEFSPDGKRVVTSGSGISGGDMAAKVWDIASGRQLLNLDQHAQAVASVAFSPDGKRIVTGSIDKTLKVWNAADGKQLLTLQGHTGQVSAVAYSPDGNWIASGSTGRTVKLWDAESGHETRTMRGHVSGGVSGVAFSPDGKRLISGSSDQTLKVWDISNVKPIPAQSDDSLRDDRFAIKTVAISGAPVSLALQCPTSGFSSVAFSADGQRLVTSRLDQTVNVWDAWNGHELLSLKGGSFAALSFDGKLLASGGSDKVLRIWNVADGKEKLSLKGHTKAISSVAFSRDGQQLVSASDDHTVKIWNVKTGKESRTLNGHTDAVGCVAFSPDGIQLASAGRDQIIKLWDTSSGKELFSLRGHKADIRSVAFSPDGTWLASASHDQTVKLWGCSSGNVVRTLEGHNSGVMSVSFSADGKRLVSASGDRTVRVWDTTSFQTLLTLNGHTSQVIDAGFSPNGRRLVSASFDRTVKVWDLISRPRSTRRSTTSPAVVTREYQSPGKEYLAASRDSRPLTNGDFSDGLKGWQIDGGAGEFKIVTEDSHSMLTTAGRHQNADTGRLWQYFKVPDDAVELQFSLIGGADSEQTHVSLWQFSSLKRRVSGRNSSTPLKVSWNVMSLRGAVVSLEITDHSTADWGFLGVSGFKLTGPDAATIPIKESNPVPLEMELNQVPLTLKGHSQQVIDVAFNADGTRIASASRDGTVRLWDAVGGKVTHILKFSANQLAFSPDGKQLATVGHEKMVKLWDVSTGKETQSLNGLAPAIIGLAFGPDGKRLAAGNADGTLKVWDIISGKESLTLTTPAWHVAFSPDGRQIASAGHNDQAVKLWDATNGRELLSLKVSQGGVSSVAFSPDGKQLMTSGYPSGPTAWDLASGRVAFKLKASLGALAVDPMGRLIATGDSSKELTLFDAINGQHLAKWKGHTGGIVSLAFSRDGKRLVSGSQDLTLKVWDLMPGVSPPGSRPRKKETASPLLKAGEEILTLKGHGNSVNGVVFSVDGKRMVTASSDQTAKIWDAANGRELLTLKGHTGSVTCVAISNDGNQVATGGRDHLAKLWDANSGQEKQSMTAGTHYLTSVDFSPDGMRLASASILTTRVWDTKTGRALFGLKGHFANVESVIFSSDGKWLASCSHDLTVKLRDAATGKETLGLKGHRGAVTGIAFTPDGKRIVSCSNDQTLKVWDTASGKELLTLIGHTSSVTGVAISKDGKRFASVSSDRTARVWDAESGQEILTVKGHSFAVNGVAISPDGQRLATASDDGTAKLWSITLTPKAENKTATIRPVIPQPPDRPVTLSVETKLATQVIQDDPLTVTFKGHVEAVTSVVVSPNGTWMASGSSDGVVVWGLADRKAKYTLRSHGKYSISSMAISSDGKRLAASVDQVVKVWDAENGNELQSLNGHTGLVNSIAFSPDGKQIASSSRDQSVRVWDSKSGKTVTTLTGKDRPFGGVAFSPDGKWLAGSTSSSGSYVVVWNTDDWDQSRRLYPIHGDVRSLAFSPDSQRLVTSSEFGRVMIWDVQAKDELLSLHHRQPLRNRLPGPDRQVRVDYRQSRRDKMVTSVAFNHDGSRIATALDSGAIRIWNARTGQKLLALDGHRESTGSVAFSPDGKSVVSGGGDSSVKMWTLEGRPKAVGDGSIVKLMVDPKKAAADLRELQGVWRLTNKADIESQLPNATALPFDNAYFVIKDETVTAVAANLVQSFTLTIDPDQTPKALDMINVDDVRRDRLLKGVYSMGGDTLKIALEIASNGRPENFEPLTRPVGEASNQPVSTYAAVILTCERMKEPFLRAESIFDFASGQRAVKELNKLGVRAHFGMPDRFRLKEIPGPGYIGIVTLPLSESDGTVSADVWKAASSMNFIGCRVDGLTDSTLRQLTSHRGLYGLTLTGKYSASKDGVALLKHCPHFQMLELLGLPQTVEVLTAIAESSDLKTILISGAAISPELLAAIVRFKNLESLTLIDIDLTNDTLIQLAKLRNLKMLSLPKSRISKENNLAVSDEGLRAVKSMEKLKRLSIYGHGIDRTKLNEIQQLLRDRK